MRYPWLHVGHNALFWLPVFVLYLSSMLRPAEVLLLEAVYYTGVVVLEIPSGYASDRIGRTPTLWAAAVAWVLGSAVLAGSTTLGALAAGQLLLATGRSFQSGTDTALLYDTLQALGRTQEFAQREATAQAWGFATLGLAALIGGFAGSIDLRLGHALSAAGGLVAVVAVAGLVEPPIRERAEAPLAQIRTIASYFRHPALRWTFASGVAMTALVHVPYELLQPWLDGLLQGLGVADDSSTPPAAGVVIGVTMLLAAAVGPWGPTLVRRLGPASTMALAWALLVAVLGAMAWGPVAWVVPLVALRSVPMALASPTLAAVIHPLVGSNLRATWMSVQSLAGRLAFATLLAGAAGAIHTESGWTVGVLGSLLWPAAAAAVGSGIVLWLLAPATGPATAREP